ncbi:MAG TPA: hypothetical protein VGQ37_26420 [Vicinamibacterales bacterium]|jgi:hypothetical protein|nr:hypothetical protein [Vicinamibacterales bacterium]
MNVLAVLVLLLAAQPVVAQPADWDDDHHQHHGGGARIMVFRDYHLAAGDSAHGPIIVIGGAATIDGHADDDVVVLGGRVRLGPQAVVDGEVVTVGGGADVNAQATVHGGVHETVVRFPDSDGNWSPVSRGWLAGLAFAVTVFRLLVVLVVASLLTLVAPGWVRRISWRASEGMASAAAIGFACQIAFIPVLVVLVAALAVSIVGIPLIGAMPFLMAAAGLAGTAGFTAVAARIGARMRGTTVEASNALFVDVLIGIAAVSAVTVFARLTSFGAFWTTPAAWSVSAIGLLIEYIVWTIGIGAACASLLARWNGPQSARTVPPAPVVV